MEHSVTKVIPERKQRIQELEREVNALVGKIEAVSHHLEVSEFDSGLSLDYQVETEETRALNKCQAIATLKSYVTVMDRDIVETEDLQRQISNTERNLESTGSTRNMQQVQDDLGRLDKDM